MYSPEELKFIASLPLEKIAISASCSASGDIGKVLHTDSKSASAVKKGIHPIVCKGYQQDANHIETSITLANLLDKVSTYCDSRFGSHFPIPSVITSKMYAQANHHPLLSLNEQVHSKLTQKDRGYILITAQAFAGKTEWAYSAVKNTLASYPSLTQPPQIDGYFFARRYASTEKQPDPNSTEVIYNASNTYVSEVNALQSLIATARKTRGVFASTNADGTSNAELFGKITYDMHADEDVLYDAFKNELEHLAKVAQPSADKPLILLLDGADELWGLSENSKNIRPIFPKLMPTEADLPAHTHIIITSRQGSHLTNMMQTVGGDIIELNIQTNDALQQDVEHYFQRLLVNPDATKTATGLQAFDYANELQPYQKLLQDKKLQQNIITASEGSFGYIPYLVKYLLQLDKPNRESTITAWRNHPQSLPAGIYGMRARELVGMYAQVKNKYPDIYEDFVYALASLSVVKAPLSANDVARLFFYDDFDRNTKTKREELIEALSNNSVCFSGSLADEPLVFQHKTLGELTYVFAMVETHLTTTIEQRSQTLAEQTKRRFNEGDDSIDADNVLYFIHHGISQSIFDTLIEALTDKHPKPIPVYQENHLKYLTLWGVYHFIKAHSKLPENKQRKAQASIQQILALLHNAGFLQTLIRTSPDEQSKNAIRATYIQADKLAHLHDSQRLHWKIESQILQHFDCLLEESMMMGGILWNMLGAWQQGQAFSEDWKGSIDKEAIITQQAGTPPDFDRMIEGYEHQAMTECGQWLVTTGENGTAIWDLRDGLHRAVKIVENIELKLKELNIYSQKNCIYISSSFDKYVVLAIVSLDNRSITPLFFSGHDDYVNWTQIKVTPEKVYITSASTDKHIGLLVLTHKKINNQQLLLHTDKIYTLNNQLLRFSGHTNTVSHIQLQLNEELIVITSASKDKYIGLLSLSHDDIKYHQQKLHTYNDYIVDQQLLRFSGHTDIVLNTQLNINIDQIIIITSGSQDTHIGLLVLSHDEIKVHKRQLQNDSHHIIDSQLLRFSGHTNRVKHSNLQLQTDKVVIASASGDKHIGLLALSYDEIRAHQQQLRNDNNYIVDYQLLRFSGHTDWVRHIQLQIQENRVFIISGSQDKHIGLLVLKYQEIKYHQEKLKANNNYIVHNQISRFSGHTGFIWHTSLQIHSDLIISSGSYDKHIGLLSLNYKELQDFKSHVIPQLLCFSGHTCLVTHSQLSIQADQVIITSVSDRYISLLSLNHEQIKFHQQNLQNYGRYIVHHQLIRFNGDFHFFRSSQLKMQIQAGRIIIASASGKHICLLLLSHREIQDHHQKLQKDNSYIVHNRPLYFSGHTRSVEHIQLKIDADRIIIASSSDDFIFLLSTTYKEIQEYQTYLQTYNKHVVNKQLLRFRAHYHGVEHSDIQINADQVIIASASRDKYIGLLVLSHQEIKNHQRRLQMYSDYITREKLLLFSGHTDSVYHTELQVDANRVTLISGSEDKHIGLLSLKHQQIKQLEQQPTKTLHNIYDGLIERYPCKSRLNDTSRLNKNRLMLTKENIIGTFNTVSKTFIYSPFNQSNFHPHHMVELNEREIIVVGGAGKDVAIMMFERINPNQDEQTDSEPRAVN